MARKEIKKPQLKALVAVCGNKCAMHDVQPPCAGYTLVQGGKFVGEIAHISAAEEGGMRWVDEMDDEERNANENLMILCPNHHTLIDQDEDTYTIEYLKEKKRVHEAASSTSGTFEPSAAILEAALVKANQVFIITNVNSSSGTQNNATSTNAGSGTQMNFNGNVTFVVGAGGIPAGILPLANMNPVANPVIGRTLALSVKERVVNLPSALAGVTADIPCYWFEFNEKIFVAEQVSTSGDFISRSFDSEGIILLLKTACLYDGSKQLVENLFDEIRSIAQVTSLRVVIAEISDRYAGVIPFDLLTEADFEVENTVQFMQTAGGR